MSYVNTLATLWSFETANFSVFVDAVEEDCSPEDQFSDPEDVEAIRDGSVEWFAVHAYVLGPNKELLGEDYLGGCAYETFDDFRNHMHPDPDSRNTLANKARGICIGTYFPDMVREVCEQARDAMRKAQSVKLRAA